MSVATEHRRQTEVVLVPRAVYEALLASRTMTVPEFVPTATEVRRARAAERAMKRGEGLSFDEFTKQLDAARRARRR